MREIKFRAWHQKAKVMEYDHTPFPYDSDYWDGICCTNLEIINNQLKVKSILFLQYTGLRDKNGREIYEGDILINLFGESFEVVFYLSSFVMKSKTGIITFFTFKTNTFEIIGNIYENPELLK